ncbi:MAG TPA: cytochrome c [Vicinamibacterales bacterium]
MKRLLVSGLLMSLVLPGCADSDGDLPREYRRLAVPEVRLASASAKTQGEKLFLQHCALCHGERGDGRGVRREGLTRSPRDFTNATWRRSTSPRRVFYAIREGLPRTPMPNWKALSEQDGWDMTAYVLSLSEQP